MRARYSALSKCKANSSSCVRAMSGFEHHRRDLAAVIALAAMGGAAIAEEALLLTIGAGSDDIDLLKTQSFQPVGAIGLEIEAIMAGSIAGDEEAGIARLA